MHAPRPIDDIDADLHVEAVELDFARRSGPGSPALPAARSRLDALLDERLMAETPTPE